MSGACIRRPRAGALSLPPPLSLCAAAVGRAGGAAGWSVRTLLARMNRRTGVAGRVRPALIGGSRSRALPARARNARAKATASVCGARDLSPSRKKTGWVGGCAINRAFAPAGGGMGGSVFSDPPHDRGTRRRDNFSLQCVAAVEHGRFGAAAPVRACAERDGAVVRGARRGPAAVVAPRARIPGALLAAGVAGGARAAALACGERAHSPRCAGH